MHSTAAAGSSRPQHQQAPSGQSATPVVNGTTPIGQNRTGRRLLVIRHGERIDFTFNVTHENWVAKAFDEEGRYRRFNINMPRSLPSRKDGHNNYVSDTPLTEIGYLQAKITGRALKDAGWKPTIVFASPAYRSVQTAVGILKGLCNQDSKLQIHIEPGLFEWGAWFRPKLPSWMSPDEFSAQGYPINISYKPVVSRTEIASSETLQDYYSRSHKVVQRICERFPDESVVLFVAHGASLDTCTRQLVEAPQRTQQEFYTILHQTPYLAVAAALEDPLHLQQTSGKRWKLTEPPICAFQHQGNASYDWRLLSAQHVEKC